MKKLLLLTMTSIALLGTAALEFSAHAAMTIEQPKRSPSTGEAGNAILTDEGPRRLPVVGVILPDANGTTGLNSHIVAGKVSPVTGKEEPARYKLANGVEVPVMALAGINTSSHTAIPLVLPSSAVAALADMTGAIVAVADKATGGAVGTAAATVDVAALLNVTQTTASQTLTLPSPTVTSRARRLAIYNSGSASFTILGASLAAGAAKGALWNGSAWVAL